MAITAEQARAELERRGINVEEAMRGSVLNTRPEIPGFLAGAATGQSAFRQAQLMMERAGNLALPGQPFRADFDPEQNRADQTLREAFPRAALAGEIMPQAIGGPSRPALQVPFSAALGAISTDDPVRGGVSGAIGGAVGLGIGEITGRVTNALRGAQRGARRLLFGAPDPTTLPSGIRTTVGRSADSRAGQQLEQSLASNPLTNRPFIARDAANQDLIARRSLDFLGVQANTLKEGLEEAFEQSIAKIRSAVPNDALITLTPRQIKLLANKSLKGVEFPSNGAFTGRRFRNTRSDLSAALKSPKALTRRKAREAINALDDAASNSSSGVDAALYAEGRSQYRRWSVFNEGRAVNNVGTSGLRVNAATLRNNLEKSFGKGQRLGGKRTGDETVDALFDTANDLVSVGDLVPNSGTPTRQAASEFTSDLARTGGLGTLGRAGAAELSQTQIGAQILEELLKGAENARVAGAVTGRVAAIEATEERE